jgi:hypothetical protein
MSWCLATSPRWAARATKKAMWLATWTPTASSETRTSHRPASGMAKRRIRRARSVQCASVRSAVDRVGAHGGRPPPSTPPHAGEGQDEDAQAEHDVGDEEGVVAEPVQIAATASAATRVAAASPPAAATLPADVEEVAHRELRAERGKRRPVQRLGRPRVTGHPATVPAPETSRSGRNLGSSRAEQRVTNARAARCLDTQGTSPRQNRTDLRVCAAGCGSQPTLVDGRERLSAASKLTTTGSRS